MMTATPGVVTLTIPAAPEHVRLARLLAGGVAAQCGLDIDAVEDVRIAIDECCHALIGGRPDRGTITLSCSAANDVVRVEGWGDETLSEDGLPPLEALSEAILHSVTDTVEFLVRNGHIGFVMTKRGTRG
ncbi:MAG: ATP-binding protein [Acidimicrobiia bacterium]